MANVVGDSAGNVGRECTSQRHLAKDCPNIADMESVVKKIRAKSKAEQNKGPVVIDPPELYLPPGKKRERARRQHNAQRPWRSPKAYIPRARELGLEQYQNRPNRSDRPFGLEGHEDHIKYNHYDNFEQVQSEMERKIKREGEMVTEKSHLPFPETAPSGLDKVRKRPNSSDSFNGSLSCDDRNCENSFEQDIGEKVKRGKIDLRNSKEEIVKEHFDDPTMPKELLEYSDITQHILGIKMEFPFPPKDIKLENDSHFEVMWNLAHEGGESNVKVEKICSDKA